MPKSKNANRLNILVTAGPTREYFDSVRFISNPSSGRMGFAVARAAAAAGHRVTLVSGPVELADPAEVDVVRVTTAAEMATASRRAFRGAHAAVFTAAVCDYRPARRAPRKKAKSSRSASLRLVPTEDIAAALGRIKRHRVTICFAMEDHAPRRHAEGKLLRKHCDAVVLNSPENVGERTARVQFLIRGGRWESWAVASKETIARRIVTRLERLVARRSTSNPA